MGAEPGSLGLMPSTGTQLGTGDVCVCPLYLSFPPGKASGNKPQAGPAMETRPDQD